MLLEKIEIFRKGKNPKLSLNKISSNLLKYILEFFTLNEYIELSKICKCLYKIVNSLNLYKEYIDLTISAPMS